MYVLRASCFSGDGGCVLRGTIFLLVQKDGEERARQGEGLFTKPPFSLDPHPPKFVIDARPAEARARRLAPLDTRRAVRMGMSESALLTTPPVILRSVSDEESKRKFATRFGAKLRMKDGIVSAYPQTNSLAQAILRHFPPHRDCAGRAERGGAHGIR